MERYIELRVRAHGFVDEPGVNADIYIIRVKFHCCGAHHFLPVPQESQFILGGIVPHFKQGNLVFEGVYLLLFFV